MGMNGQVFESTYTVHEWAHTWLNGPGEEVTDVRSITTAKQQQPQDKAASEDKAARGGQGSSPARPAMAKLVLVHSSLPPLAAETAQAEGTATARSTGAAGTQSGSMQGGMAEP